jgi:hypothetical protein
MLPPSSGQKYVSSGIRLYIQIARKIVIQTHGCGRRKGNQSRPISVMSRKMALFWAITLSFITGGIEIVYQKQGVRNQPIFQGFK